MEKTDDPLYNVKEDIKNLEKKDKDLQDQIKALNYFLTKKYPDDLEGKGWLPVSFWYADEQEENQRKQEIEHRISFLESKGYHVTKDYVPQEKTQK